MPGQSHAAVQHLRASRLQKWCRFLGRRVGDGAAHSVKTASEKRPGTKLRLGRLRRRGWLYGDLRFSRMPTVWRGASGREVGEGETLSGGRPRRLGEANLGRLLEARGSIAR